VASPNALAVAFIGAMLRGCSISSGVGDADKRRFYFRVSLTACAIRGFDDPDENAGMKVLGVAVNDAGELCFEGVQGGELRLVLPEAIKHVVAGSIDDNRSWTAKLGLSDESAPPLATEVVPVVDAFDVAPDDLDPGDDVVLHDVVPHDTAPGDSSDAED